MESHPEKQDTLSQWQALIHFRIPNIETIAKTESPMRFIVKYYNVYPLGNEEPQATTDEALLVQ